MFRYLPLSNSEDKVKISRVDYKYLSQYRWRLNKGGYVERTTDGALIHRIISGIESSDIVIDHKDRDRLNNSRCNLRPATRLQNSYNRAGKKDSITKRKNVNYDKRYNVVYVRVKSKREKRKYFRGFSLNNLELATGLADLMMIRMHGEFSATNRPLSYYRENDPYKSFYDELSYKEYVFITPEGNEYRGSSIRSMCKEHNLSPSAMSSIIRGDNRRYSHKGWRGYAVITKVSLGDFADKMAVDKLE